LAQLAPGLLLGEGNGTIGRVAQQVAIEVLGLARGEQIPIGRFQTRHDPPGVFVVDGHDDGSSRDHR